MILGYEEVCIDGGYVGFVCLYGSKKLRQADIIYCPATMTTFFSLSLAEGDAGFYSSIQYIYDKFKENRIEVERTAGIPAFIAAGALAGLHIVKQEEQIIVIPGMLTAEELSKKIKTGNVIVIMKLSQCVEAVHTCIRLHPETNFHYFENVGTGEEFYTSDRKQIQRKIFPYFSLMIIQ